MVDPLYLLQVPAVLSDLIQESLQSEVDDLDDEQYHTLTHVSEEQQQSWLLQDAVVRAAPKAMHEAFVKVHEDFLAKDMVCATSIHACE